MLHLYTLKQGLLWEFRVVGDYEMLSPRGYATFFEDVSGRDVGTGFWLAPVPFHVWMAPMCRQIVDLGDLASHAGHRAARVTSSLRRGTAGSHLVDRSKPSYVSLPMGVSAVLVPIIFLVSGGVGLVYEVLWTRQLELVFGVTTYAVATVLATFMGGLALGSYLGGRVVDRVARPLAFYAALEAGIGAYALGIGALLAGLRPAYLLLRDLGLGYTTFAFGRALLAGLVLLLPTTLMGATYPALVRYWVRTREDIARGAGWLYFLNTAGAIAGCLLAGFFLIERLGLRGTTEAAAATNLVLGLLAWLLSRSSARDVAASPAAAVTAPSDTNTPATLILWATGVSGFVSLAAEVLWTRGLLRYIYNSTYAFTTMLAVFLFGIAAGSAAFTALLARRPRPLLTFALLQAGGGLGLALACFLFPLLPQVSTAFLGTATVHSFQRAVVTMVLRGGLILFLPAAFLGASFPLATAIFARATAGLARGVGRAYATNTVGAILGSLATTFLLIPAIGMHGTALLLVSLSLVTGAIVAAAEGGPRGRRTALAIVAVGVGTVALLARDDVFRRTFLTNPGQELVYYAEGSTDTVGVAQFFGQRVIIYEDQRGTAATTTYGINFFLGHLPMLLHPGTPRRVLHICFGVGNSLAAVAAHDELERVDNVELSPHVVGAAGYFFTNDGVIGRPKVRTIIDDGRNHLLTTPEAYDVILLEPPETFTAGVVNLYTVEFYRDALAHLAPDGVMMQWIPTGQAPMDEERHLFGAFAAVFPHRTMWWQLSGGTVLLVGSREPLRIDYQRLRAHFAEPAVARDMALSQVRDVDHLLSFFMFDDAAFAEFVRGVTPTTDDRTVVDFTMPRYVGSGFGLGQFNPNIQNAGGQNPFSIVRERKLAYEALRRPVTPLLTNLGDERPETVAARIEERRSLPFTAKWYSEADWPKRPDGRAAASASASGGQ